MPFNLADILALGASGAYDVTAELCGNSAAVILSVIDWLDDYDNWQGAAYELTAGEQDTIDAMLAQLLDEVMVDAPVNGGNGVVSTVILLDKKAQNTAGGTFTSGARRTRALQTEVDPDEICVLSGDEFVLVAGNYFILWRTPAYRCNHHQSWLYNVTGDVDLVIGSSEHAHVDGESVQVASYGFGLITVAADQSLRIEHRCGTTFAISGFGTPSNMDEEVYTQVVIIGLD